MIDGKNMEVINLGNRIVNNYLLKMDDGYLLIDTGYPENFSGFLKNLKKQKIQITEIKYILLTHAHDDHAGFLGELMKLTEAKVILKSDAIYRLSLGVNSFDGGYSGKLALFTSKIMAIMGKGEHKFPPVNDKGRYIIADEENPKLSKILGGEVVCLLGHTKDSIGFLTNDGILFCGDAAMNGIPSINRITIWIENLDEYIKSWNRMIELDPKIIYPGHGKPFFKEDLQKYLKKLHRVKILRG